ncbi:glycoside hydrolase family protein [Kineosporia sp. J2-2]|uniref:Glycoside hydrolase family protein n=1 Tax=Kineosporia corallincola TaxID=2835133 RepID=A0ABS5TID9_9ACTN|nr:glycoside hydrolase family protein [Kineosporia corallincola]MBT0770174.1 glycoside hydrolase family protein [Kineosporia corallincola]
MPSLTKRTAALVAAAAVALTATATAATAVNKSSSSGSTAASTASTVVKTKKDTIGSVKKGAATWYSKGSKKSLKDSGVSWYYTWDVTPKGVQAPKSVDFVPMIWGADSVTKKNLATAKKNGDTLLGFNEPDWESQSNMTVKQALDLWPQLEKTGMRLGSPAVAANAATDGAWLDRFMKGAKKRGYRVDFITLHWYGADFRSKQATQQLKSFVQAVHAKYPKKKIWITEYSLIDWSTGTKTFPTATNQANFVKLSTSMLEHISYVEHYSWFAFPTSAEYKTGLYGPGAKITKPGKAYRAAG